MPARKVNEVFMERIIITVGSVTYALKLRKLLRAKGIEARQIKYQDPDRGCTHGIEISKANMLDAIVLLKENGMEYNIQK